MTGKEGMWYPKRRKIRECILRVLYEMELNSDSDPVSRLLEEMEREELAQNWANFGVRYLENLIPLRPELDEIISEFLIDWNFDRLSLVDRNILRMGAYELIHEGTIPIEVTINEMVELSKVYGTEDSPRFVNAVLDRIAKKFAPPQKYTL